MADIIALATDAYTFLKVNGLDIVTAITMIVTGASALANFTKTDVDNKALAVIAKALNFIALNFKK